MQPTPEQPRKQTLLDTDPVELDAGKDPLVIEPESEGRAGHSERIEEARTDQDFDRLDTSLKVLAVITLVAAAATALVAARNDVKELYAFNIVAGGLILAQGFIGAARFKNRWRWPLITTIASLAILALSFFL